MNRWATPGLWPSFWSTVRPPGMGRSSSPGRGLTRCILVTSVTWPPTHWPHTDLRHLIVITQNFLNWRLAPASFYGDGRTFSNQYRIITQFPLLSFTSRSYAALTPLGRQRV